MLAKGNTATDGSESRLAGPFSESTETESTPPAVPGAPEGHVLDLAAYLATALAVDGVLDSARANPVNCNRVAPTSGAD